MRQSREHHREPGLTSRYGIGAAEGARFHAAAELMDYLARTTYRVEWIGAWAGVEGCRVLRGHREKRRGCLRIAASYKVNDLKAPRDGAKSRAPRFAVAHKCLGEEAMSTVMP